jgi:monofunctional biosynthetic peptidoglycan transglycosylase
MVRTRRGLGRARRRQRRPALVRWSLRLALVLLAIPLAYSGWVLAAVLHYDGHDPGLTSVMRQDLERRRAEQPRGRLTQQWVDYEHISPALMRALVVAEDARFVDHKGFDVEGIRVAMAKNMRQGEVVAGGSTITQQLAKNLFLSHERSYLRKLQEVIAALILEAVLSKQRILELYANVAEWGDGLYGAQAAARYYFGVDAGALTKEQAARLAAMLPRPRYYQANPGSRYLRARSEMILGYMHHARLP